jgi:hypothetical protein
MRRLSRVLRRLRSAASREAGELAGQVTGLSATPCVWPRSLRVTGFVVWNAWCATLREIVEQQVATVTQERTQPIEFR